MTRPISLLVLLALGLTAAPNAYAYLEPGTGSLVIQGAIAAVAGVLVAARLHWGRLKRVVWRKAVVDSDTKDQRESDVRTDNAQG